MTLQIVLLRGINLGAHRRVAMGDLRDLLTKLGHGDVRTYLQSGNVVLTSAASPESLGRELEQQIAPSSESTPRSSCARATSWPTWWRTIRSTMSPRTPSGIR